MKILITSPSLHENENVSGISSVVRQIIERGTCEYRHFESGRRDGEPADAGWFLKQIMSVARFRRCLKNEQIDIVHLNTTFTTLAIVRDAVYAAAARIARVPVVLHVHGGRYLIEDFNSKLLKKIAEKMLRFARVVIVLSELEKGILESRRQNPNIEVLGNAVSIDELTNAERERNTDEKIMVFLGRLHESKGLHEIVEACRVLKNEGFKFRFRCFGAGAEKDFFLGEMKKILSEKFDYGGVVAGAEKQKVLSEADIFLLPSRYGEGLPMAMLEAMAAGCVVVVSEMASIGAVIQDGENGFLIEPRNVKELTEKLRLLLSGQTDQTDWKNLRRNARKTVADKFNLQNYIKKLEAIYAEVDAKS